SVDSGEGKVSFVDIGRTLGGTALGHALLASAVLGNLALYLDYMASGARPLQALADDGLFPPIISHVSKRFGTPIAAIALVAGVNAVLIAGPFQSLVIIDVMLMVCSYAVIFIAAVHLRRSDPDLHRPFKIPLGTRGLAALMIPPLCLVVFMLYMTLFDRSVSLFGSQGVTLFGQDIGWYGLAGLLALLSGPLLYPLLRHRYGGPAIPCHEAGNP
ncbi:MAG: APC family permease, partial [Halieaceae bacterium]|nr:APC family permease [Halieaceae bacterium]